MDELAPGAYGRLAEDDRVSVGAGPLATLESLVDNLGALPGRKIVVLFSDGFRILNPPLQVSFSVEGGRTARDQ